MKKNKKSNNKNLQKPHGIECECICGFVNEKPQKIESKFEGYIGIKNTKTKEEIKLPMRSFVNNFLLALYRLFSGAGTILTKKSSVEWSGSTGNRAGLLIGSGNSPVNLSDTNIKQLLSASINYGQITVTPPYALNSNIGQTKISKTFTNNRNSQLQINELGLFVKTLSGASYASTSNRNLISRDVFYNPTEISINVPAYSDIIFEFLFNINQAKGGQGGFVLNFMKLIHNLLFKGNLNNSSSLIVNYNNSVINNFSYATGASAGTTSPFYLLGNATQKFIGIVVGSYDETFGENPPISIDEKTFLINETLTYNQNEIVGITYPQTNMAQFIIQRLITNNTNYNIKFDRVGLITRGNGNGTTLNHQQAFIAINKPIPQVVTLVPGQSYRVQYVFKISV